MTPLKLAIVTRRFWPMSDGGPLAVGEIANRLQQQGHQISVVTARWEKIWPTSFYFHEFEVTRVTRPAGPWGSFRFSRGLARWLSDQQPLDGVLVWGLGEDVSTVRRVIARTQKSALPLTRIVARVDRAMVGQGIAPSPLKKSVGMLAAADSVLVDCERTKERLSRLGLNRSTDVQVVPDPLGVQDDDSHIAKTDAAQSAARMALAEAHPILDIASGQPLVITGAPMDSDGGLFDLLDAWPIILKTYPKAKLWFLGDGPQARQIWNSIEFKNLVYSAIMPGYFDDLAEVFVAGDLYVHPSRSGASCNMLTRAMSRGLCPLATTTSFTNQLIRKDENGLQVPPGNPKVMAEAILHGLKNRELRIRLGSAAKKIQQSPFSIENVTQSFLQSLTQGEEPKPDSTSSDSTAGTVQ